jgi:hypothetical protein
MKTGEILISQGYKNKAKLIPAKLDEFSWIIWTAEKNGGLRF